MSAALGTWSKAPREAAAVWYAPGVSTFDRMVALDIVVALDGALGPVPGHLDAVINRAVCGTVNRRERQNYRRAIARMQARGLLFEHEGMVFLLYSEAMWRAHRSLSEKYATPVLKVVRQPAAEGGDRDVNRDVNRDIKVELSARNSSIQDCRERERVLRESTTCSPATPPMAAPPVLELVPTESGGEGPKTGTRPALAKAKRTRARTPRDEARDQAVKIFNWAWAAKRGCGHPWVPRKKSDYAVLATVVDHYTPKDGPQKGVFDVATFKSVVVAWVYNDAMREYGGWNPVRFFAAQHFNALTKMRATGTESAYEHDY